MRSKGFARLCVGIRSLHKDKLGRSRVGELVLGAAASGWIVVAVVAAFLHPGTVWLVIVRTTALPRCQFSATFDKRLGGPERVAY